MAELEDSRLSWKGRRRPVSANQAVSLQREECAWFCRGSRALRCKDSEKSGCSLGQITSFEPELLPAPCGLLSTLSPRNCLLSTEHPLRISASKDIESFLQISWGSRWHKYLQTVWEQKRPFSLGKKYLLQSFLSNLSNVLSGPHRVQPRGLDLWSALGERSPRFVETFAASADGRVCGPNPSLPLVLKLQGPPAISTASAKSRLGSPHPVDMWGLAGAMGCWPCSESAREP
ncbi:uncharacterized protein LOC118146363 [Callithrix jacchus]|uniref:uncharacterized protein LOC118146363 n=1 Tax=Callithrix jacchus TaxID=9483 RepID=UPI00159EB099|nr:uncharacterized protein LOC118146363 [Callithrix jacchus]